MKNSSSTLIGILSATAVGAIAGILFAPDKGSNTRKKIKTKAADTKDEIVSQTNKLSEELNSKFRSKKVEFERELDGLVTDMHLKADDVMSSLEKKLESLRKRNSKVSAN